MSEKHRLSRGNYPQNVIRLTNRKAEELVAHSRDRLRALLFSIEIPFHKIAAELVPESHAISVNTARTIIGIAARKVLTPEEYSSILFQRFSASGSRNAVASDFTKGSDTIKKAVEARGEVLWSLDERNLFLELLSQPEFQYPASSRYAGKPFYTEIARVLNEWFHGKKPVRKAENLCTNRKHFQKILGIRTIKQQYVSWSDTEKKRLVELARHCRPRTKLPRMNFAQIASTLNQEFHDEELKDGRSTRNAANCYKQFEFLKKKKGRKNKK